MKRQDLSAPKDIVEIQSYDVKLLLAVLFLVGVGMVMVYSASGPLAMQQYHSDYYFLKRQVTFALLSILALVFCRYLPYRIYRAFSYPFLILSLILLVAVHIPGLGNEAGGAKRWLDLGLLKFQPSEVARLALIVYLAYSLEKKQKLLNQFAIGVVPHLMVLVIFSAILFTQPDFGSLVIFWILGLIMMFIGGVKIIHLASILLPAVMAGWWFMTFEEYRIHRIIMFLNPWEYATTLGYQTIHSLMAFGTGGIFGVGLGKGYQKLFYLPEPHTDFIFSVIGEELGMIGVLIIISLYAVIFYRGLIIARNAADIFGCFIAMGITVAMGLQICINMGVALGMLPTKGLTLPFISYGGTSLLLNMAAIGILMNIAADRNKRLQK
jgi:cell division protein FtsW